MKNLVKQMLTPFAVIIGFGLALCYTGFICFFAWCAEMIYRLLDAARRVKTNYKNQY